MQQAQERDFTKRLDAGLWRRLIRYMKPYHKYLYAIMGTMAISALCDAIFPLLTREAIDRFISGGAAGGQLGFAARYIATVLAQSACIFSFCMLCGRAECGINRHIRRLSFKRLEELSFSFYDQMPVGFIISRMTRDTARLGETVAWGIVDLFWSGCYIVITAMAMFLLEGRATPKNPSRARELLDMAAKYEYPNAATALKTFFPDSATP